MNDAAQAETTWKLPTTWAETRENWQKSDWLALAAIPLIFGVVNLVVHFAGASKTAAVTDSLLRVALCAALLWNYRRLLADHWARFRANLWRNIGIVVAGAILLQVVISLVNLLIPRPTIVGDSTPAIDPATAEGLDILILYIGALGPLAIVMVEEAVFRHTLLVKLPWWRNWMTATIGIPLNGALFGAIHYGNFGSLIRTVPYMAVGILMNLIYLWRRNLWAVMLIHLLNNAVLSIGALTFLLILRSFIG
jgi:membrane protease YdiL (CAAX protease family)